MTKFMLLYSGGKAPEESEMPKFMKDWETWNHSLGKDMIDPGNPMGLSKMICSDGSASEGNGSTSNGYSIIEASSLEEATKIAKRCPVLHGGSDISIFETFPIM